VSGDEIIVSEKDAALTLFAGFSSPFMMPAGG
jgi:hypothetical protein